MLCSTLLRQRYHLSYPIKGDTGHLSTNVGGIASPQAAGVDCEMRISSSFVLPQSGLNLEDLERSLLVHALHRVQNNQTKAANLLGITGHTLRYRLEKDPFSTLTELVEQCMTFLGKFLSACPHPGSNCLLGQKSPK